MLHYTAAYSINEAASCKTSVLLSEEHPASLTSLKRWDKVPSADHGCCAPCRAYLWLRFGTNDVKGVHSLEIILETNNELFFSINEGK